MSSKEETRRILQQKSWECFLRLKEYKRRTKEDGDNSSVRGWCPVAWDDIMCWDPAAPSTAVVRSCPDYVPKFKAHEFAVRTCMANGEWKMHPEAGRNPDMNRSWTNYTACYDKPPSIDFNYHAEQADRLTLMYTIGYSVSLAALIIAVFIMLYCRRLHCKSNTLHINLFMAFILRASLAFLKDRLFVGGLGLPQDVTTVNGTMEFVQEGSHWECRLITVFFMFAISATQTWILMEGLYLYMLIHRTIVTERYGVKPYIVIGWVTPWIIVIPWIIVKQLFENTFCWNMQENEGYFWLLKGPWIAIVLINFFFFLDIFRVLFMRVRSNHRHVGSSKYRKFAKFILVLIPLFGIMYIVLLIAFPADHVENKFNVVYLYVEMGYNSFQGFILALLFCFFNEDVHSELRRMWRRHKSRREDSKYITRSMAGSTFRHVSRDHNSSPSGGKRTPRSLSGSWRKEALTNSVKSNSAAGVGTATGTGSLGANERSSSPADTSSLGEKRPLCAKFSSGSSTPPAGNGGVPAGRGRGVGGRGGGPGDAGRHPSTTSSGGGSVSSLDCGPPARLPGSEANGPGALLLGRSSGGMGNGTGASGIPAKIILLPSQASEDRTIPLHSPSSSSAPAACSGLVSGAEPSASQPAFLPNHIGVDGGPQQ